MFRKGLLSRSFGSKPESRSDAHKTEQISVWCHMWKELRKYRVECRGGKGTDILTSVSSALKWESGVFWNFSTVIPRLTKIIRSGITFVSRNLRSRNVISHQSSRVGGSPLCDVVSSFLCHTHTDGKDKLLEWPDRSCLLLYVSARIH